MRVMIAPDSFGETLTAVQAAEAMASGWSAARPDDDLVQAPQSDGGPGFVDVAATQGGVVKTVRAHGPLGREVEARWLWDVPVAYIEVAQTCGLGLLGTAPDTSTALTAHSRGVGENIAAALDAGATTIVVGLGGSSCTDGGRAMIEALGGLDAARTTLSSVRLVAATDVDNPLLGPGGAAAVFGPQKGADPATVAVLEERNAQWAVVLEQVAGRSIADRRGAGAAGGIGAALLALGATRASGALLVAERTDQDRILASVDLVLTGEGKFDSQSLRGKLVTALAAAGERHHVRTIVFAGQVILTDDEIASAGVEAAHSITDFAGSVEVAMNDAREQLIGLVQTVAAQV